MSRVTLRLAMWSGPRNISTAMMRAWENRDDCSVVDEPFYACYLVASGLDHPMREAVIASQSSDWTEVVASLTRAPCPSPVCYQKHMTHHLLPDVDLSWTKEVSHCFLIRNPVEVVNSYRQKRAAITAEDIGINRQLELYETISTMTGKTIPVIDAEQVLRNPRRVLASLCAVLDIPFQETMLEWPAGRRSSDGVWAPHWYQAVEQSTGFAPYRPRTPDLPAADSAVAEASLASYEALRQHLLEQDD